MTGMLFCRVLVIRWTNDAHPLTWALHGPNQSTARKDKRLPRHPRESSRFPESSSQHCRVAQLLPRSLCRVCAVKPLCTVATGLPLLRLQFSIDWLSQSSTVMQQWLHGGLLLGPKFSESSTSSLLGDQAGPPRPDSSIQALYEEGRTPGCGHSSLAIWATVPLPPTEASTPHS